MKNNIIETDILIIGGGTLGLFIYSQLKKKFRNIKVIDRGGLKPKIADPRCGGMRQKVALGEQCRQREHAIQSGRRLRSTLS